MQDGAMRRTILALVLVAAVGAACSGGPAPVAPSAPPPSATSTAAGGVNGVLRHVERISYSHSRLRQPLVDWTVQALAPGGGEVKGTAQTDARGVFTIYLPPGPYVLTAVHPGATGLPEEPVTVPSEGFAYIKLVWHTTGA
jgi:hypothetical protein